MFHAGTRRNIIPDDAKFEATMRSFSPEVAARVGGARSGCAAASPRRMASTSRSRYEPEYPVTVNNAGEYDFVADTIREVFGEERFTEMADPITGSEDFSRVLDRVPGAFVFLGASRRTRSPRRATIRPRGASTTACSATAPRCWPNSPSADST